jgi:hypothetical protein
VASRARTGEGRSNAPGRLVAIVLSGAWRSAPPPPECSPEELTEVAPLLLASGAGALAGGESTSPRCEALSWGHRFTKATDCLPSRLPSTNERSRKSSPCSGQPALSRSW